MANPFFLTTIRWKVIFICLALAIGWTTIEPTRAPAAPDSRVMPLDQAPFGLNTHLATRYFELETMHIPADVVAQAGTGWAREDIHWFRIQPTPDTWDWSFTDRAIALLIQRGISIVAVIGHPPGWATPYRGDAASGVSFYAPDPQRFAAFTEAVVRRYGGYVKHWEIWNEPDNPHFWKPAPDAAAYALLLKWAAYGVRRADPHARIVLGGINPFDTHFLRIVAEEGAWNTFDILAIHPYVSPTAPEAGNLAAATDGVRAIMQQYGERPIWVTEIGWSSGRGDRDPIGVTNEQDQANYLVRATLILWRAGVERIFWYTLKDDPGNPYGIVAEGQGYGDYSRLKPAFYAFQALSRNLAGVEYVGMRDLFEHTTVINFENFGGWRRGDQPNGTLTPTESQVHGGRIAAQLNYTFTTNTNDYVVFRRDRGMLVPDRPYAIGMWVYGDGSGNLLKIWLRDGEGEVFQYTLGAVGPAGWRLLQTPIGGTVAPWDRISGDGNGRLDLPIRIEAIVLDDQPDSFQGRGTIYLDDIVAISGPEAYNMQLRRGNQAIDVVWAPTPLRASISSRAAQAQIADWNDVRASVTASSGRLILNLGPAPQYVIHQR
ncbi:MAG TPA: glycosyl hydrolase [Roseiflexaceae bacterium]|nr:glycosyl hydrolase [Roseiflexaceae bacterium]HMP41262.1 glycosyl hydrolase [Roseiflexaceae bacterium]